VVSLFLFIFPNLIHKRKTYKSHVLNQALSGKVLHISHRGGAREGLENTIPTFRQAILGGTNMLEMDVCMTKDGILVVSHDEFLSRLCGHDVHLKDLNYSELPRHADKIPIHFSVDLHYDTTSLDNPYFPTLEEVFTLFPTILLNIELKTQSHEAIMTFGELVKKHHREDLTMWGCKLVKYTKIIQQNFPNTLLFCSIQRALWTYALFVTGLLPFVPIREDSIQMPLINNDYYNWKLATEAGWTVKTTFLILKFINFVSPPLFWHLNKRGIITMYWVLNSEQDFTSCAKTGVNGIMTDTPTLLRKYLDARGLYIPNKTD